MSTVTSFSDEIAEDVEAGTILPPLRVILAAPRGFCAGVERAIQAVEDALLRFGAPVYVRRPIVHNLAVVRDLEAKGAIFVEELAEIPAGSIVIFSAHGVAREVAREAEAMSLKAFDAICPLVLKVHNEVVRHNRDGRHVILVGHPGHPEVEGTLGQLSPQAATVVNSPEQVLALSLPCSTPVAYAIQTTYSVGEAQSVVDTILERFDDVAGPTGSDICYATTNRQAALLAIAGDADAVIVAGAAFSSNANRLVDLAKDAGCASVQLIAEAADIDWDLLGEARTLGLTAAASTPERSVREILTALAARYRVQIEERTEIIENVAFRRLRLA